MVSGKYLSAQDAARQLDISTATLYSYVSRGLLRSEPSDGKTRAKRYYAEDVDRLLRRQTVRRNPEKAAELALNFGTPVLDSKITLIKDGKLYYRGYNAAELAQNRRFEEVAALLWSGDFAASTRYFGQQPAIVDPLFGRELPPVERFQMALAAFASQDLAAFDFSAESVAHTGARILHRLTSTAVNIDFAQSVAQTLQQAWLPDQPDAKALLEAVLILCADHELNVSAFTARCVASARATPYEAVIAGLAALSGYRHGGATERVSAFFREADGNVRGALKSYLQRGWDLPGIGHTLYPDEDPRGRVLLDWVYREFGERQGARLAKEIEEAVAVNFGRKPNIDFALVALARALALPADAPLILFAIGRTAGWIGHIIEQYGNEELIRPRARYVGPEPRVEAVSDQ